MWTKQSESRRYRLGEDDRPNYLRYGDVFMTAPRKPVNCVRETNFERVNPYRPANRSGVRSMSAESLKQGEKINSQFENWSRDRFNEKEFSFQKDEQSEDRQYNDIVYDECGEPPEFQRYQAPGFSNQPRFNRFSAERELPDYIVPQSRQNVRMQRRRLPQLQWYEDRGNESDWSNYSDYEPPRKRSKYSLSFPAIWQKFVITFTSLLSLICLTWIAYNWKGSNTTSGIEVIKPEKPYFKVLPDVPGGTEIPYQDKVIYNRVDPSIKVEQREILMSQTEEPGELPMSRESDFNGVSKQQHSQVSNYTIIDDKDYYVKCQKSYNNVQKQVSLIRQKLSTYENQSILRGTSCSVRKVANTQGQLGEYILIGPFPDDITAGNIGRFCQITGEVITVQKKQN